VRYGGKMKQDFWEKFSHSGKFSIHEEVANYISNGIRSGVLSHGEKLPSLRKLESLWKLNYYSIKLGTSILTQQGILYKQQGRGIFVSPQSINRKKVILYFSHCPTLFDARLYTLVLRELLTANLRKRGIDYILVEDDRPREEHETTPPTVTDAIASGAADAIIGLHLQQEDKKWFFPLPVCKTTCMEPEPLDYANIAELLKRNQCRRPALIAPFERYPGKSLLLETLEDCGISFTSDLICKILPDQQHSPNWGEVGYRETAMLLDLPAEKRPDALIVYPDGAVAGAIQAILERKINVPQDLKVVFHRNVELGYFCPFPAEYIDVKIADVAEKIIRDIFYSEQQKG